jgi:hypothetical protein
MDDEASGAAQVGIEEVASEDRAGLLWGESARLEEIQGASSGAIVASSFWPGLIDFPTLDAANVWEWLLIVWNRLRLRLWLNGGNLAALIAEWVDRVLRRTTRDVEAGSSIGFGPHGGFRPRTSPEGFRSVLFLSSAAKLAFLKDPSFKALLEEYVGSKGAGGGMAKGGALRSLVMMMRRFARCEIDCYDVLLWLSDNIPQPVGATVVPGGVRPGQQTRVSPSAQQRQRLISLLRRAWRAAHRAYGRLMPDGRISPPTGTRKDQLEHPSH